MKLELKQRWLFTKYNLTIFDSKVLYQSSKFGNKTEVYIPYEELTNFKESHYFNNTPSIIGMCLGIFGALVCLIPTDEPADPSASLFYGIIFLIALCVYFISKEKVWKIRLQNGTYIFLFKNIPNEKQVDQFIDTLFETRKKYLKDTYLFIEKNMPYESLLNNFIWLKKIEAIDNEEFEFNKTELNKAFNVEKRKIGF